MMMPRVNGSALATPEIPRPYLQRRLEHAPRVGLADGEVDRQCGWRHEPPTPPRRRDDPLTLQELRHVALRDVDHRLIGALPQ
jgi:hypothetical protein